MELETLKKSWERVDEKLRHASTFNEKLLDSMFTSRVGGTVEKLRRLYNSFYIVLTVEIVFLVGIIAGNPFDFRYQVQYLPYWLLLAGVTLAYVNLIKLNRKISSMSPDASIEHYLKQIINAYDKNKRFEKWFGVILLSIGLMVPFTFLPNKLERMGISDALLDTMIMISVTSVLYFLAFRLGAFKNPHKQKLEKDLREWEELRSLAKQL